MTRYLTALALVAVAVSATGAGRGALTAPQQAKGKTKKAAPTAAKAAASLPADARAYLKANCVSCHNATVKQGNLDLAALPAAGDLSDPKTFAAWVKVHDRVRDGEMPPAPMPKPPAAKTAAFLKGIATPMVAADDARTRREGGRAVWRRMNRYEYENALRDLFDAPWLPIKEMLPEDGEAHRFNKVGTALDVSHVQMGRYLSAAEYALREALSADAAAAQPAPIKRRLYTREEPSFFRAAAFGPFNGSPERATFPIIGCASADTAVLDQKAPMTVGEKDPERREQESLGVVASAYEPIEPRWNRFRAPVSGQYTLRLAAHTFWAAPENEKSWWRPSRYNLSAGRTREPVTLYAEVPPRALRRLTTVEVGPQAGVVEVTVYLNKGETVRPDAARLFRSRPPAWRNPLATKEGQPGVAYRWLEVEGPHLPPTTAAPRRRAPLFGDLPLAKDPKTGRVTVAPRDAGADADRLLRAFVERAYRRPVTDADVAPFAGLARMALGTGSEFTDALLTAYSAVLCSPGFVTLEERPGPRLDDHALASRLSFLLWNSEPDAALRALAAKKGALSAKPGALKAQADRMLADPKAKRFVDAFTDYWLDLRKVQDTSADATLYPDYYLDDYLAESAADETRAFFTELLKHDLPAKNLVDSDFVTINERLATHYGIPGVKGVHFRRVAVPDGSPRGGLLTQASVLKVTANGTTTSPVLRGVWINERILGRPVPPPPAAVPAVEPDTRGAVTIRQQLEKHRSDPTCNTCHVRIDPPGFALESFDVFGGWRERYRALGGDPAQRPPGRGKNGQPFEFHPGPVVDPSGAMPGSGAKFADVRAFKKLLLKDERQVARNLVHQFVTYGTGAPVRFGDRPEVEAILDRAAPSGYGVRSLLYALLDSELFRSK